MDATAKRQLKNYPFTPGSTMLLSRGVYLGSDIITSAMLYPTSNRTDFAYISFLGRKSSTTGAITVSGASGTELCSGEVPLNSPTTRAMAMYTPSGVFCGVLTYKQELTALLNGKYYPASDAFVFTPSVFRPLPYEYIGARLRYNNVVVDSVIFAGSTAAGSVLSGGTVGEIDWETLSVSGQFPTVSSIVVTGSTGSVRIGAPNKHVYIKPGVIWRTEEGTVSRKERIGDPLRIVAGENEIRVGVLDAVRK